MADKDLNDVTDIQQVDKAAEGHGTVEFLLRRMRHKGDLPAFSKHIIEINSMLSSLKALTISTTGELANIILKDFSMTNKLLRIVNSAIYGSLSGKITTISKALLILGFEKVRMIASALLIFEHLQNKSQATELKEAAMESFMSGVIAMDLAENMKISKVEEVFICAMLSNLGKMLVICYFPEEYGEIKKQMIEKGIGEGHAAISVLGISYNELGMAVSRSWNFPDTIVRSMESPPPGVIEPPKTEFETLRNLTSYSNELCEIIMNTQDEDWTKAISEMSSRYQKSIPVPVKQMETLLETATSKIDNFSGIVNLDRKSSTLVNKLTAHFRPPVEEPQGEVPGGFKPKDASPTETIQDAGKPVDIVARDRAHIVTNGIAEITDVMKGGYNLSDVIYMILETMYRGFGFNRVLFCLKDVKGEKMSARFGLGDRAEDVVKVFQIRIGLSSDIFNIAITQGKGILIEDADAPTIVRNLPEWYQESVAAPAFLIYPLVIKGNCIGMFYADKDKKGPILTEVQRNSMEELRNMAIDVIMQKHG
ncbi:MAG: HDOD domain-containing protein [Deltaproteobacteria bacterium]|nr:HDOD domain-containing protein [Deltaproteobacteria bacterium]